MVCMGLPLKWWCQPQVGGDDFNLHDRSARVNYPGTSSPPPLASQREAGGDLSQTFSEPEGPVLVRVAGAHDGLGVDVLHRPCARALPEDSVPGASHQLHASRQMRGTQYRSAFTSTRAR